MAAWARSIAPSTNLSLCSSQVRHRTLTISSWVNRDECLEHGVNSFGEDRGDLSLHPTVKPVAMVADAIRDCSHRRGIVLDAFVGSGTTLIAAETTGRRATASRLIRHTAMS